jgi:hypothetical protein
MAVLKDLKMFTDKRGNPAAIEKIISFDYKRISYI